MTQSDMVERVEQLLSSDKPIPAKLRNELTLSLLMELSLATKRLRTDVQGEFKSVRSEMAQMREAISADVSSLRTTHQAEIAAVKQDVELVRKKSIVLWIQENKRLAAAVGLALLVTANLWFESEALRLIVSWWLGVPVDLLPK